jgi:hypothetical protein
MFVSAPTKFAIMLIFKENILLIQLARRMSMATEPQDPTRRVFFGRLTTYAVGAAIIGGLGPNVASAQAKVAQSAVSYQDKPKGTQRCDACNLFQPPSACKVVDGAVSPQGWCSLFSAKT